VVLLVQGEFRIDLSQASITLARRAECALERCTESSHSNPVCPVSYSA
jgi:hypothetical protein